MIPESPQAITKILLPSKRGGLLHRARLVDFLHEHIERKLLLVSAPAGYGKTAVLIDFAHDTSLPVCWYSIDPEDSDPKIFLEYLVASIRRRFPDFGSRTIQVLAEPGSIRDEAVVVNTLVTEIFENVPGYFVLILDDYHLIEESEKVNQVLDSLLHLLPENAHVILSSRTLPTRLTLTRLTARQEIAGLGQNDLRFSAEEIRAFVKQNYAVDLSEKDAFELAANSEGWITGILLTTHGLWQGLFKNLAHQQGPHGNVFHYLATEVFEQQSQALRHFMLDSSILDQLNPSLCNELFTVDDSEESLQLLERRNLFITRLESEEPWYRYHHLFQEFLESRLRESDEARWQSLHRRAADLFESRGRLDQAVHHRLKIRAFKDAARTLEKIAKDTFDAGHWLTLAKWIDAVPIETIEAHPNLIVWRGHIQAQTGDQDGASERYLRALKIFETQNDRVGIGKTLIKRANSLRFQGQYQEAIEKCQLALTFLPSNANDDIAEARRLLGISNGRIGNWSKCIEELELALTFYTASEDYFHIALTHQDLGVAYRTVGKPVAEKHLEQAIENWRKAKNVASLANTLNSIGVVHHRKGEYNQAIEACEKAVSEARQSGQLRLEALALASLGDVYRDKGEYLHAQETFEAAFEIARRINEGFVITYTLNALGETLLESGDLGMADELVHQALEQAKTHHSDYELGLTHISLGIVSQEKGDKSAAAEYLGRAVALLDQGGAKRDSARAHLYTAQARFVQGDLAEATHQLKITAALGKQISEDQFIVGGRGRILPLVKYAASKQISGDYYVKALMRIESESRTLPTESPRHPVEAKSPRIQAYALGKARVAINGKQISRTDWASNTAKELFFLLLVNPKGLRKDEILDALWAEIPTAKANAMFHTSSYRVRRALLPDLLVYENGLYYLNDEIDLWDDVSEFNNLINRAKNSDSEPERAAYSSQAIELYQGDYFEDSYNDWCISIRSELLTKYLDASYALAEHYANNSEIDRSLEIYKRILAKDPCREEIYQALMRIQSRTGDRSGAIRTFQRCAETLHKELKLDPSPETVLLYEQVLNGKSLDEYA